MKTVGIVGGGQLGMMMAEAARNIDCKVIILDPTPNAPASLFAEEQIVGSVTDEEKIKELASKCDVLTFEIELAGSSALRDLHVQGKPVHPSPKTLEIIKDKFTQKEFLVTNKIPVADFLEVKTIADMEEAGENFGYPFVLKAKRDSYDGKGNMTIESPADNEKALKHFEGRELYAEAFFPFTKELAIMVARGKNGVAFYPVVETVHVNHICDTVYVPAPVSEAVHTQVLDIAKKVLSLLEGQGVFGIEMFYQAPNKIVVNEIAPRVHNSGHYTIEACETSQFEQHIRAVTDMDLGSTAMKVRAAVMVNILGERNGVAEPKGVEEAEKVEGTGVHLYGKLETRVGRKMGHITAIGDNLKEAEHRAKKAKSYITL